MIHTYITNPGERPSNPTFGAGLRQYLFTQIESGNLEFIKNDIQEKINKRIKNTSSCVNAAIQDLFDEDM